MKTRIVQELVVAMVTAEGAAGASAGVYNEECAGQGLYGYKSGTGSVGKKGSECVTSPPHLSLCIARPGDGTVL